MRVQIAQKICELVEKLGALLIRAPPSSGKTSLLQLIAHVINPRIFKNVYYISLVDFGLGNRTLEEVFKAAHPDVDLAKVSSPPKCPGTRPETRPTLLLVDEGQVGLSKDLSLWGILKGALGGFNPHLRIIVVSAWSSNVVFEGTESFATHVGFMPESTISLWPTEACTKALQLTEDDAAELWNSWCEKRLGDKLVSCNRLRDYLFSLAGGQPGAMVHMLDWLLQQGLKNAAAYSVEEKARSL